jgi:hypothetical protein
MRDIIKRILLEDKKERFLQYIINELVNNTKIDYDEEEIIEPPFYTLHTFPKFSSLDFPLLSFSNYCKDKYGLTEDEIEYVWDQYKTIITDKITNK